MTRFRLFREPRIILRLVPCESRVKFDSHLARIGCNRSSAEVRDIGDCSSGNLPGTNAVGMTRWKFRGGKKIPKTAYGSVELRTIDREKAIAASLGFRNWSVSVLRSPGPILRPSPESCRRMKALPGETLRVMPDLFSRVTPLGSPVKTR